MAAEEGDKKVYGSVTEFLEDPDNGVDDEAKDALLECEPDVQTKVMERGSLETARNKSSALLQRIRYWKKTIAIEKGEEPPPDDRKRAKKDRKRERDGDGPKKRVEIDVDLAHPGANAKTELTSYLQIKIGRCMQKGDFKYTTEKDGDGKYVATVELPCLDNESMLGEPEETAKAAEQSAAKAFLESKRDEIMELNQDARPLVISERYSERQSRSRDDGDDGEPKAKKPRKGGKGGGGGKGGMMAMAGKSAEFSAGMSAMMGMMMQMMAKGGSKGKGKGKGW